MHDSIPVALVMAFWVWLAQTEEVVQVKMSVVDERGGEGRIGSISAVQSLYGVVLTPDLHGLAPGIHGLHVHQTPACGPKGQEGEMVPGLAAAGHYGPAATGRHAAPCGNGHLGELPAIFVTPDGKATSPLLAPRLKLSDLKGRALVMHHGGDTYADYPQKLGGGWARRVCGVVGP